MLSTFPQVSMLGVIKKREGRLKGPTPLPQFGEIFSEEVYSCELCFVPPIFRFWFLVTFGKEVTKIRKYYITFVYILQGKMGKMEKTRKKITKLK